MPRISQKLIQALPYAILIWAAGFIWGSLVFMTPSLRAISPIRFVSSNPAISFPILAGWLVLSWLLARSYLKSAEHKASDGIELGAILAGVNILLDLFVLVVLLPAGMRFVALLAVRLGFLFPF